MPIGRRYIKYVTQRQQQHCRHHQVHCDADIAATKHMTQDAQLNIVCKTGNTKHKTQHAGGCEYVHIEINGNQWTIYHPAGVRSELRDQSIVACNERPRWSTKSSIRTVREMKHHDVVSAGISQDGLPDKHPRESMKQALITVEEARELYMVEVIVVSHFYKQQLISCSFSTCLLLWQGKEVGYSGNCPTCAWPWIWPKWPTKGVRAPHNREPNLQSRNLMPRCEKSRCGVLRFLGMKRWRRR